ncbi:ATP-binding protein [Proteinivorax hydrogeniformans]|uniref:ATP-binding protein n=1 Tax=Proteinivorax hydrogeniformans TaxID=1826727 RepID=A0AAU8HWW5_9FIRM
MKKNPYLQMLDNDNYSTKIVTQRDHKKKLEDIYKAHPSLKKMEDEISSLQSDIANRLAMKFKGQQVTDLDEIKEKLAKVVNQKKRYLTKYSIETNYKEPNWKCAKCQDTGKVYKKNQVEPCACTKENFNALKQKSAGLPPKLVNATFKNADFSLYQDEDRVQALKVYRQVKDYLDTLTESIKEKGAFSDGLYIYGKTGVGKTFLLGCAANYLLQRQVAVKYLVYADLLDRIRQTYSQESGETESQILRKIITVPVLLIDDLGMEKNTEFSQKYLGQIIDSRYRNLLPTIITSNFTLLELEERTRNDMYGERVIWRCVETSNILELTGNLRRPN